MDIPLPGEDDMPPPPGDEEYGKLQPPPPFPRALLRSSESPPDLTVFEPGDSNKYSPSHVTAEEEQPVPSVKAATPVGPPKTVVLGKAQAKRRLLAFSAAKLAKKTSTETPVAVKETSNDVADSKDQDGDKKKKKKKVPARVEKERAIIASIEQLKREEMALRGPNFRVAYYDAMGPLGRTRDDLDLSSVERDKSLNPSADPVNDNERLTKESSESRSRSKHSSDKRHSSRDRDRDRNRDKDRDRDKSGRRERRRSKEKPQKPTELPIDWKHFKSRGYKFDDVRQLKFRAEDKEYDNSRRRQRYRRSRSHDDKKHRRSPRNDDINKPCEDEKDYIFRLFVHPPKPYYPYYALGLDNIRKEYPRVLLRLTKTQPHLTVCENPNTSTKYYKTRESVFSDSSPELVEIMKIVIENRTNEYCAKRSDDDSNVASSLAALQVSYDEDDMDDNLSTEDVGSGKKRERSWFLPESEWFVTSAGSEPVNIEENADNVEKTEVKENEETFERTLPRESKVFEEAVSEDIPENLKSPYDETFKTETETILETSTSLRVRSKWDSDYEEDRGSLDSPQVPETTAAKEEETPITSPAIKETVEESRVVNNEEESSASNNAENVSNEPSDIKLFETGDDNMELSEGEIDEGNVIIEESINEQKIIENVPFPGFLTDLTQISESSNIAPEGTADFKLVSEYEEFMKAVSFDAVNNSETDNQTVQENGDSNLNEISNAGNNDQIIVRNESLKENEVDWESEMKSFINERGPFEGIQKDFEKLSNKVFDQPVEEESQSNSNSLFENVIKKSDIQNINILLSGSDGYRSEDVIPGIGDDDFQKTDHLESKTRREDAHSNGRLIVRNEKHALEDNDKDGDDEDDEYAESMRSDEEDGADLETDSDSAQYTKSSKSRESNNIMIAKMALKDLEKNMKKESKTTHKKKKKLTKKRRHKHESKRKRSHSSSSDDSSSDSETSDCEIKTSKRKSKKRKKRKKKKAKFIHSDSSDDSSSSSSSTTSSTTTSSSPPSSPSDTSDTSSSDEGGTKKRRKGKKSKKRKSKKRSGKHKKEKKSKKSHKKEKSKGEVDESEDKNCEFNTEIVNNKDDKHSLKRNTSVLEKEKDKSSENQISKTQDREISKQPKNRSKKLSNKKHKESNNDSEEEQEMVSKKHKRKKKKNSKRDGTHSPDGSKHKNSNRKSSKTYPVIVDSNNEEEQNDKDVSGSFKKIPLRKEHYESGLDQNNEKHKKDIHKKSSEDVENGLDCNNKTKTKGENSQNISNLKMGKLKRNYRSKSSRNDSSEEENEHKGPNIKSVVKKNYDEYIDDKTGEKGMRESHYYPLKYKTRSEEESRKSLGKDLSRDEDDEKVKSKKKHKISSKGISLEKVKGADEDQDSDIENKDFEKKHKRQDKLEKHKVKKFILESDFDISIELVKEHRKKKEKRSEDRSSSCSKSKKKSHKSKTDKTVWDPSEGEDEETATYKRNENESNKSDEESDASVKNEHKKHKKKKRQNYDSDDNQLENKEKNDTDTESERSGKKRRRKSKLYSVADNKKSRRASSTSSEHTPNPQPQNFAEGKVVQSHKSISGNEKRQERKKLRYDDGRERKKSHQQDKDNKEHKDTMQSNKDDIADLEIAGKHKKTKKKKKSKLKNKEKVHKKKKGKNSKFMQKQKNKDDEETDFNDSSPCSEIRQNIKEKDNCKSVQPTGNKSFPNSEIAHDGNEFDFEIQKEIKQEMFSGEEFFDEMSYDFDEFAVKQETIGNNKIRENFDNCERRNSFNAAFSNLDNSENISAPSILQIEKDSISHSSSDLISDLNFDWSQSTSSCEKQKKRIFREDIYKNIISSLSSPYSDNAQMPNDGISVLNNESDQHTTQQRHDSDVAQGVLLSDKSLVLYSPGEESDDGDNDNFEACVDQQNSSVKSVHTNQSGDNTSCALDPFKQSSDIGRFTVSDSVDQTILKTCDNNKDLSLESEFTFDLGIKLFPHSDNQYDTSSKKSLLPQSTDPKSYNTENIPVDNLVLRVTNISGVNNGSSPEVPHMQNTSSKNYLQPKSLKNNYDTNVSSSGLPNVSSLHIISKFTENKDISLEKPVSDHQHLLSVSTASGSEFQVSSSTGKIDEKVENINPSSSVQLGQVSSSETLPQGKKSSRWGMTTSLPKKVTDVTGKFDTNIMNKGFIHNRENLNLKEFNITESSSVYQLDSVETEKFVISKENFITNTDSSEERYCDVSNENTARHSDSTDSVKEENKTKAFDEVNETPVVCDTATTKVEIEKSSEENAEKPLEENEKILKMCDVSKLDMQIEKMGKECDRDESLETNKILLNEDEANRKEHGIDNKEWNIQMTKEKPWDSNESDRDCCKKSNENLQESSQDKQELEYTRESSERSKKESSRHRRDSSRDRKDSSRRRRDSSRDRRESYRHTRDLSRDRRDSNRDIRDSSRDRRESNRVTRGSSRDRRDSNRDTRDSSRDRRDSNRDTRDSSRDRKDIRDRKDSNRRRRDSSRDRRESNRDMRDTSRDRKESYKDRRDSSRDRREPYKERRNSSRERNDLNKDRPQSERYRQELNTSRRESRKEKYETSRDKEDKSRDLSRDRQELCEDLQKVTKRFSDSSQDKERCEESRQFSSEDKQKPNRTQLELDVNEQESKKPRQEVDKGEEHFGKERRNLSESKEESSQHMQELNKEIKIKQNEYKSVDVRNKEHESKIIENVEKEYIEHDSNKLKKVNEKHNKDRSKQQYKRNDEENKQESEETQHSGDISVEKDKNCNTKRNSVDSAHSFKQAQFTDPHESVNLGHFPERSEKEIYGSRNNKPIDIFETSELNYKCIDKTYKTCKKSSVHDDCLVNDSKNTFHIDNRHDEFSTYHSNVIAEEEPHERIVQYISPESETRNQKWHDDSSFQDHINMEREVGNHSLWDKKETNLWTGLNPCNENNIYYDKNFTCNDYVSFENQIHVQTHEISNNSEHGLFPFDNTVHRLNQISTVQENTAPSHRSPSPKLKRNLSPPGRCRSPVYRCNRSPVYKQSPSPPRHISRRRQSRSPLRKRSCSPNKKANKSPQRKRSRSPVRKWNKNDSHRRSPSPASKRGHSPLRKHSRSPVRKRSRSPVRKRSRSPFRKRSRSPARKRSRSPARKRSRSPARKRSRSPARKRSRSPVRKDSRSPLRKRSRSPVRRRSRSRSPRRNETESRHNRSPSSRYRCSSPARKRRYGRSPTRSLSPRGSPVARRRFSRSSVSPYRHSSQSPGRKVYPARGSSPGYQAHKEYSPRNPNKISSPLHTHNEDFSHPLTRYDKNSSVGEDRKTDAYQSHCHNPTLERLHLTSRSPSPFIKHHVSCTPNYTLDLSSVQQQIPTSAMNVEKSLLPQANNVLRQNNVPSSNYTEGDSSGLQNQMMSENGDTRKLMSVNLKSAIEPNSAIKNLVMHESNLQKNAIVTAELPSTSIRNTEASSPVSSPLSGIKLSVADSTISDSELPASNKHDVKSMPESLFSVCKISKDSNKDVKIPQAAAKAISNRRARMKVERKRERNVSHSPSPESPRRLSLDERIKLELESAEPKVSHPPVEVNPAKHSTFASPSKKHCPSSRPKTSSLRDTQQLIHSTLPLKTSPSLPQQTLHEAPAPLFTVPPPGYTALPTLYATPPPVYTTPSLVGHNVPPTYQMSHPAYQQIQNYSVTGYPTIPHNPYEMHAGSENHYAADLHYNVQNSSKEHMGVPSNVDPATTDWNTPEAFIGNGSYVEQNPSSSVNNNLPTSKVVQVGNVLQVVPVDLPNQTVTPVPCPATQTSTKQTVPGTDSKPQITSEKKKVLSSMPTVNKTAAIQNWIQTGVPTVVPPPEIPSPVMQSPNLQVKPASVRLVPQPPAVKLVPQPASDTPIIPSLAHAPRVAVTMTVQHTTATVPSMVPNAMVSQVPGYHTRPGPTVQLSVNHATPTLPPTPVTMISSVIPGTESGVSTVSPTVPLPVPVPAPVPERNQPVVFSKRDLLKHLPLPVAQSRIKLLLAAETQKLIEEQKRLERDKRKEERDRRRQEKELKKQERLKLKLSALTTENILKKALMQDRDLLDDPPEDPADIDLQEMRLIEEAMAEVPEMDEEEEDIIKMRKTVRKKKLKVIQVEPLPAAGKGILISPGFRDKSLDTSLQKTVKFADGIHPGEGTSPSGGEDLPSPPPPPRKLPKEKRFKKKKKKKKSKVVELDEDDDDDDEDDDCSPPPPPPGSPPPHLYGTTFTGTYPAAPYVFPQPPGFTVLSTGVEVGSPHTPLYTPPYQPTLTATTTQFTVPVIPTPQS